MSRYDWPRVAGGGGGGAALSSVRSTRTSGSPVLDIVDALGCPKVRPVAGGDSYELDGCVLIVAMPIGVGGSPRCLRRLLPELSDPVSAGGGGPVGVLIGGAVGKTVCTGCN